MAEMNFQAWHERLMSFPSNASHSVGTQIQSANFVKVSWHRILPLTPMCKSGTTMTAIA